MPRANNRSTCAPGRAPTSPPLPRRHRPDSQAAQKGYELLKKKADALKVRFRDIAKKIYAAKVSVTTTTTTTTTTSRIGGQFDRRTACSVVSVTSGRGRGWRSGGGSTVESR